MGYPTVARTPAIELRVCLLRKDWTSDPLNRAIGEFARSLGRRVDTDDGGAPTDNVRLPQTSSVVTDLLVVTR
jgi:hypothetical protein